MYEALGSALRKLGMVARACDPSTREVEAGRSEVQGHPQLHSEFEANLDHIRIHTHGRGCGARRGENDSKPQCIL